jgi:hypothetical protein
MDDLTMLRDEWGVPRPPSSAARARARARLAARAGGRRRGRRRQVVAVGAVTVAVAAGVIAVENLGGSGPPPAVASAQVLERAASAAAKQPFTAPRDDQWVFTEDRITWQDGSTSTEQRWRRADGGGIASIDAHGRLDVQNIEPPRKRAGRPVPGPFDSYAALSALPTDPAALLRWAYAQDVSNGNSSKDAVVYLLFAGMLRDGLAPPDLQAAMFRAMKQIPGVTLDRTVDVLGRPAYALGQTDDWLHEELLLDKQTYAYLGQRSTVVRDATIDPLKAGNATGKVTKGSTVVDARVSTAVVDKPGERR